MDAWTVVITQLSSMDFGPRSQSLLKVQVITSKLIYLSLLSQRKGMITALSSLMCSLAS